MNKEVKKKWIAALRSGDYVQGGGCLRENNRYCCLGVLTDLYVKEHPDDRDIWKREAAFLDDSVQEWAGLPRAPLGGDMWSLNYLNDSGTSFDEIADIIDKHH